MTGDMRKVAVTRVAATRMKSRAPLVTITLARSVLSSDLKCVLGYNLGSDTKQS